MCKYWKTYCSIPFTVSFFCKQLFINRFMNIAKAFRKWKNRYSKATKVVFQEISITSAYTFLKVPSALLKVCIRLPLMLLQDNYHQFVKFFLISSNHHFLSSLLSHLVKVYFFIFLPKMLSSGVCAGIWNVGPRQCWCCGLFYRAKWVYKDFSHFKGTLVALWNEKLSLLIYLLIILIFYI